MEDQGRRAGSSVQARLLCAPFLQLWALGPSPILGPSPTQDPSPIQGPCRASCVRPAALPGVAICPDVRCLLSASVGQTALGLGAKDHQGQVPDSEGSTSSQRVRDGAGTGGTVWAQMGSATRYSGLELACLVGSLHRGPRVQPHGPLCRQVTREASA